MKRKLVFATNNAHKLEEVAAILGDQIELLSLNDIGCHTDIPEPAETLEGNALLKSSFIFKNYGLDCFADDCAVAVCQLDAGHHLAHRAANEYFRAGFSRHVDGGHVGHCRYFAAARAAGDDADAACYRPFCQPALAYRYLLAY